MGQKLRERREELGLTLEQAGKLCGVDGSTLSLLERGKMPNASFLILSKVAKGLGLSLDELAIPA